jgi:hypothetical protein
MNICPEGAEFFMRSHGRTEQNLVAFRNFVNVRKKMTPTLQSFRLNLNFYSNEYSLLQRV